MNGVSLDKCDTTVFKHGKPTGGGGGRGDDVDDDDVPK
jgi:hypothetical protein